MSQGKETTVLALTVLITAALAGGGYWFFVNQPKTITAVEPSNAPSANQPPEQNSANNLNSLVTSQPNPNVLNIDGSTTMVLMVRELRLGFNQQNGNLPVVYGVPENIPNGSTAGIRNLINGTVSIVASSRPLKTDEAQNNGQNNIQMFPVAKDAVAVVVGVNNGFKGGLTLGQLRDIYTGKITNWSQLGGANVPIRVINRATASGTRDLFQDVVLAGVPFAPDGANFVTWPQDETTAILRTIGDNGISYATVSQVVNQEMVRIVPIDNVMPTNTAAVKSGKYPVSRSLFLGVKKTTSPAVKQFIEFALSPKGQQTIERSGFVSIN
jgi:phosphate transport system substrate-binding protein